jgi:hypothetical protein
LPEVAHLVVPGASLTVRPARIAAASLATAIRTVGVRTLGSAPGCADARGSLAQPRMRRLRWRVDQCRRSSATSLRSRSWGSSMASRSAS